MSRGGVGLRCVAWGSVRRVGELRLEFPDGEVLSNFCLEYRLVIGGDREALPESQGIYFPCS